MKENRVYIAIDLKSFYASVECMDRQLDPMTAKLVVADASRTEKTICLAVTPALKAYGVSGRARLFEVIQKLKEVNEKVDFIIAPPRMSRYLSCSTQIYDIYLRYIAPEDIHVYSIDEVFIDATDYLTLYNLSARELAGKMIKEILAETGITATAGVGTNLYLCKIAMDIVAKSVAPDENGVRIAELDELSYRQQLWTHRPITDFWRVGEGYAKKLAQQGLFTMGDVARCSIGKANEYHNEKRLYDLFGVNAELLIDHAWGWEPCTMADVKAYKPSTNSTSSGQVLQCPYSCEKARLVVQEMADGLALDLVDKRLVTDQVVLTVGYDRENLDDVVRQRQYKGAVTTDRYGRKIPKHAHGTANLDRQTSSVLLIMKAVMQLYDQIVDSALLVRRITITANRVVDESAAVAAKDEFEQLDLFTDYEQMSAKKQADQFELEREKEIQKAVLQVKKRYGKNAILKGMNLSEGATARQRNKQIGGHKA